MSKINWSLWWEKSLSAFKYLLALFMMYAGLTTALSPVAPLGGELGWLYASKLHLIVYGTFFFFSGATLLYGKVRRSKKYVGLGLMLVYYNFVFATLFNMAVWGVGDFYAWGANFFASMVVGALYLRWRYKTEYVDPKHFVIRQRKMP